MNFEGIEEPLVGSANKGLAEERAQMHALVRRRATLSALAAVVPVPGQDFVVDASAFADMLTRINEAFALTPAQIA